MSSEVQCTGRLEFESAMARERALEEVRAFLEDDDDDLRAILEESWDEAFAPDADAALVVHIAFSGPSDWFFAIEGIVETLAEAAREGFLDLALEGAPGKARYHAGGEEEEID
jgi:hypothetical protein